MRVRLEGDPSALDARAPLQTSPPTYKWSPSPTRPFTPHEKPSTPELTRAKLAMRMKALDTSPQTRGPSTTSGPMAAFREQRLDGLDGLGHVIGRMRGGPVLRGAGAMVNWIQTQRPARYYQ